MKLTFGTVLVGATQSSTLQLTNPSLSDSLWTVAQGMVRIGRVTAVLYRQDDNKLISLTRRLLVGLLHSAIVCEQSN